MSFGRLRNIILKIASVLILLSFNAACTPTTGTEVNLAKFESSEYSDLKTLYIYRKHAFGGSLAQLFIQLNNQDLGTIGMGQIIEAKLPKGTNLLSAIGDINQRSYTYLLKVDSNKPRYFVASYEKSLLVEMPYADWTKLIIIDGAKQ